MDYLKFKDEKFNGKCNTVSFRTYQGVVDEFRAFAAGMKGFKNQDLLAQALVEFMEKYQHLSKSPISLELGAQLGKSEINNKTFTKLVSEVRTQLVDSGAAVPPVRVLENARLGSYSFLVKTDDGKEYTGAVQGQWMSELKAQLRKLMEEKSGA